MCISFVFTLLKVDSHYDLSVLSISVMFNSYEPTRQYLGATELNTAGRRAKI